MPVNLQTDNNLGSTEQYIKDASGNASGLAIGTDGFVGIGTTSPRCELDIVASTGLSMVLQAPASNGTVEIDIKNGSGTGATDRGAYLAYDFSANHLAVGTKNALGNEANRLTIKRDGQVGIGTNSPNALLDVRGAAIFNEDGADNDFRVEGVANTHALFVDGGQDRVGICNSAPGYALDVVGDINTSGDVRKNGTAYNNPDYVFETDYRLMALGHLKDFVQTNKHLPNLPSTKDIVKNGVMLFEQSRLLLEKIEEAYLYIFQLEERLKRLEA